MAGGGPLYDIANHRIDAMHFLFGAAERVSGLLSNAVHPLAVEDSATVLLGFAGGVHGIVDVRWNSQIARDQFRIVGTEGEINLDPLNGPELRVRVGTSDRVETLPPHDNLHFPLVANFVDAVLANDPSLLACPGEQARWTDCVIEQAARAGRGMDGAGV
jgi:1,5-anhydro-D-fructose reductase (1,5-anhydro-D-mannitol-forming)